MMETQLVDPQVAKTGLLGMPCCASHTNLLAECMESKQCAPAKHHFDECAERVRAAADSDNPTEEDCVEECKS